MKKITFILLLFAITTNAQVNNYNVGDVVDDFTVTDIHGVEHNLYSITAQGKYVWLDFFFADCPPCQQTASIFNEFNDKYGCGEGQVYCLSINDGRDNNAKVEQYEELYGGSFNHAPAASNEGGSAPVDVNFGINAYPTYCLIGPDNTLVNKDIWPLSGIETFEATFPAGFEPPAIECTPLGITEAIAFDFAMYPTASHGQVNINLSRDMESSVVVYSMLGQKVFDNTYSTRNIALNLQLSSGIYFVKVNAENNSATKRIVIE